MAAVGKDPDLVFGGKAMQGIVLSNTRDGGLPGTEINMHDDEPVTMGEVTLDSESESEQEKGITQEEKRNYLRDLKKADSYAQIAKHHGPNTKHKHHSKKDRSFVGVRFIDDELSESDNLNLQRRIINQYKNQGKNLDGNHPDVKQPLSFHQGFNMFLNGDLQDAEKQASFVQTGFIADEGKLTEKDGHELTQKYTNEESWEKIHPLPQKPKPVEKKTYFGEFMKQVQSEPVVVEKHENFSEPSDVLSEKELKEFYKPENLVDHRRAEQPMKEPTRFGDQLNFIKQDNNNLIQTDFVPGDSKLSDKEVQLLARPLTHPDEVKAEEAERKRKETEVAMPQSFSKQLDFVFGDQNNLVQTGFVADEAKLSEREAYRVTMPYTAEADLDKIDEENERKRKQPKIEVPQSFSGQLDFVKKNQELVQLEFIPSAGNLSENEYIKNAQPWTHEETAEDKKAKLVQQKKIEEPKKFSEQLEWMKQYQMQ